MADILRAVALLMGGLVGCAAGESETEDGPSAAWPAAADWDDRGVQRVEDAACGPMLPVDATGMVWRYTVDAGRDQGIMVREAMGRDELEGETLWRVHETWWLSRGGEPHGIEAHTFWYRCDEGGAWQVGWKSKWLEPDDEIQHPNRAREVCEDLLVGAPSLEPGTTFSMFMSCSEAGTSGLAQSRAIEVHDPTTVTVASGEVDAIEVQNAFEEHVVIPGVGSASIGFEYNDWRYALFDAALPEG